MVETRDPEELSKEIIEKMDGMIREAEKLVQQTRDFYKEIGVERGIAKNFLESGKVPPEEKEKIVNELAQWQEEVERDIKEAQERFKIENRPSMSPKMKKGRIMA